MKTCKNKKKVSFKFYKKPQQFMSTKLCKVVRPQHLETLIGGSRRGALACSQVKESQQQIVLMIQTWVQSGNKMVVIWNSISCIRVTAPVLTSDKEKSKLSVQINSLLLWESANSGLTLSLTPLRYCKSKPLIETKMSVLWYVLSSWTGFLHSFKTCGQKRP